MLYITPLGTKTGTLDKVLFCCWLYHKLDRLAIVMSQIVRRGALPVDCVLSKISRRVQRMTRE